MVEEQLKEKGQWGKGCWVVELGTCEVIRKEIVGVINLLSTLALTGFSYNNDKAPVWLARAHKLLTK